MTEYELNAFQSEFDPTALSQSLARDPSRGNKIQGFAILKTSYFLAFSHGAGQVAIIKNQEGEAFVSLFTCRNELEKWPFEKTDVITLTYEQAKALVLKQNSLSGLVINPFGQAMFLTRNHIADVDNTMRGASGKRELRLRATSDYPIGLPPALEALLRGHEEVYRVWLVAAKDADEHLEHKLFVVDFDGKPQDGLFAAIAAAARPYMRLGETFELMKADLKLLQIAEKTGKPIYQK